MSNMKLETTKKDTKLVLFVKISICDRFGSCWEFSGHEKRSWRLNGDDFLKWPFYFKKLTLALDLIATLETVHIFMSKGCIKIFFSFIRSFSILVIK
ncbi:hypothetical protein Hanom_Chr05g00414111 [Helianthus anomalus]